MRLVQFTAANVGVAKVSVNPEFVIMVADCQDARGIPLTEITTTAGTVEVCEDYNKVRDVLTNFEPLCNK